MVYFVYCDADENGNITEAFSGLGVIPNREYGYFFETEDSGVVADISKYKIDTASGELVAK